MTTTNVRETLRQLNQLNPNPRSMGPFKSSDSILVIGDGDLSFGLALATHLGGPRLSLTTFDSKTELLDKYTDSAGLNLQALESTGAEVLHSVDATALSRHIFRYSGYRKIVFNFPHVGGATPEDVIKNQQMLTKFFHSAKPLLRDAQSQIIVSLRNTSFYQQWAIGDLAETCGYVRERPTGLFNLADYPGYQPQRTHPATREPPSTDGASMHRFTWPVENRMTTTSRKRSTTTDDAARRDVDTRLTKQHRAERRSHSCGVCGIAFRDGKKYQRHVNSAKHARKVKKQGALI